MMHLARRPLLLVNGTVSPSVMTVNSRTNNFASAVRDHQWSRPVWVKWAQSALTLTVGANPAVTICGEPSWVAGHQYSQFNAAFVTRISSPDLPQHLYNSSGTKRFRAERMQRGICRSHGIHRRCWFTLTVIQNLGGRALELAAARKSVARITSARLVWWPQAEWSASTIGGDVRALR